MPFFCFIAFMDAIQVTSRLISSLRKKIEYAKPVVCAGYWRRDLAWCRYAGKYSPAKKYKLASG